MPDADGAESLIAECQGHLPRERGSASADTSTAGAGEGDPTFRIVFLFHANLSLLDRTLPRCLEALTAGSRERYEVVLQCDGTPPEVAAELPGRLAAWGVDEMRLRRRARSVASGAPGNNGHLRLFGTRSPYLVVVEDDVVMYRTEVSFDPLAACRTVFEEHPDVPVLCKLDDHDQWVWQLRDQGPPLRPGVRSVNRVATHFIAYDLARFRPVAERFGAFELDLFIDRDDLSYNWEDLVSHVGTTGGRRIAFPESWPVEIFHCDRKVTPGSMYHTQDAAVRQAVLNELEARFAPGSGGREADAALRSPAEAAP